ncbi:MAG TPA: signal peptidase II [Conexibacter sp.]|nr:signal peptidase II [Conexibacter sp.]
MDDAGVSGAPTATRAHAARWALAGLVVVVVLLVDQGTKALVRSSISLAERHAVIGPLSFVNVHNRGVAFGFLGKGGVLVLIVTLSALALLVVYFARHAERPLLWLPTGLVLGGALGNLVDRVHHGYVTDFIHVPHWPAFNVADMCITCGVVALVLVLELGGRAAED